MASRTRGDRGRPAWMLLSVGAGAALAGTLGSTMAACGSSSNAPEQLLGGDPSGGDAAAAIDAGSGNGTTADAATSRPPFDASVVQRSLVSTGAATSIAIRDDGQMYGWGEYAYDVPYSYNLLDGGVQEPPRITPSAFVDAGAPWVDVSIFCAVRGDTTLWCWGGQSSIKYTDNGGTLVDPHDGNLAAVNAPGEHGPGWLAVSIAWDHGCAIKTDGSGWCWGDNSDGQLGNGQAATKIVPSSDFAPGALDDGQAQWRALSAGNAFTCGVQIDGSLWCWGSNGMGQLGLSGVAGTNVPTRVGTRSDWQLVSAGYSTACAATATEVYCWNQTNQGELATPSSASLPVGAVLFARSTGWKALSTYSVGTCAVDTGGALFCANAATTGAVGAPVFTDTTWRDVSMYTCHACAIASDDHVRCWGVENYNDLGGDGGSQSTGAICSEQSVGLASAVDVTRFTE